MANDLSLEDYDRLIDAIYQAGIDPSLWGVFLDRLNSSLDGVWLCLHGHDLRRNFNTGILYSRYDDAEMDRFSEYYAPLNPWIDGLGEIPVGEARKAEAFLDRSILLKSEFYNDWVRPQEDIGTGGGIVLFRDDDRMLAVSGNIRFADSEDVQNRLIDVLNFLGPHIQRAFTMQRVIGTHQASTNEFAAALDILPNAVLLIDDKGRIAHCNAPAEAMLTEGDLLRRDRGRILHLCDHDAQSVFERQFGKISTGCTPETLPIVFSEAHSAVPRMATLTPFTPDDCSTAFFPSLMTPARPVAMLSFAPIRVDQRVLEAILESRYKLTPAETRLSLAMMKGKSLSEYAEANEIRIATARTQLKVVFSKTDTHRQGQLVALLNSFL